MRRTLRSRATWLVAAALAVVMVAGLLHSLVGQPAREAGDAPLAQDELTVGGDHAAAAALPAPATGEPFEAGSPRWPAGGAVEFDMPATDVDAGGLTLSIDTLSDRSGRLRVETLDREATTAAGVDGVVLRLEPLDDVPEQARLTVDYSPFRWAYGGDWANRLTVRTVPCDGCPGEVLAADNDPAAGAIAATVDLSGGATTLAVSAAAGGAAGDFAATTIGSSGTWDAGGSAGNFSWTYPMRVPPAPGGPAPAVALAYASSSVDGRMAASNNQPSLIGEGFEWSPGAITRSYRTCGADRGAGANNSAVTGDQCWVSDNAVLAMSGHAGELVRDASDTNRWHLRGDDGTRVERRTGAANGARDGEWWVATTTDGIQYWFGGLATSNATLTVPVYGNHGGEPCNAATFAASSCVQAYQWNLDRVVDPNGNTMTYSYIKETNRYARNMTPTDLAVYDRAAYVDRVEYGTRTDRAETAPLKVVFGVADRCLSDCGVRDAGHWPDTPWDMSCATAPCAHPSPSFWTTKRLSTVTTYAGAREVERWTLHHSFPNPGDGTRAGLWLERISHTGLVGTAQSMPDVTFSGVQLANRVDTVDHSPAMNWWRISRVTTETGGVIEVSYSAPDCVAGSRVPDKNDLQSNTLRCYPVKWTPQGFPETTDFFHKYVVTDVVEDDRVGGAPRALTHYDYLGAPAWHYTDDNGLVPIEHKTWSVWRGYGAVRTTKGDPGEQTVVEHRFFRGMHGDKLPSGSRSVQLPAIAAGSVPAVNDEDVFAGMLRETIEYDRGVEVRASALEPWQSAPTASRTSNGVTVHARHVGVGVAHSRTARDGGRPPLTTTVTVDNDDRFGMQTSAEDKGDDAVTGDEKCVLTDYARNETAWIVDRVSRVRAFAATCDAVRVGAITEADVAGDDRTSYDGQAFGAAPTRGNPTRSERLKTWSPQNRTYVTTSTSAYDRYGRVVRGTDGRGLVTTTAPTPAEGGPVTGITQTTGDDWVVRVGLDPAWGLPVSTVDANGRRTELEYDALGRLRKVWKPGRDRATQTPDLEHVYRLRSDGPSATTTRRLLPSGGYATTHTLFDSLLRERQTQRPDAAGGPNGVVTDTFYDTAGRVRRANAPYLSTVAPGTDLFVPSTVVPTQTRTEYDGVGRVIASILVSNVPGGGSVGGTERWRTTTTHGGDRVDVVPPSGGVATSTYTDLAGQTTELRQYHAGVAPGSPSGFDRTRYTYDRKGRLTQVTGPTGNVWTHGYDLVGNRVTSTDPDKNIITSVFDDVGEIVSSTDATGAKLSFTYDVHGRKTGQYTGDVAPANQTIKWDFDVLGNGTAVHDQLVRTTRFSGGAAYSRETLGFTADYQPTAVVHRVPAAQPGLAGDYTYVYTYHQEGSLRTTRLPAVGDLPQETLTMEYDALGNASTVDTTLGGSAPTSLVTATGHTSFGEVGGYTLRHNGGNTVDVRMTYEANTRRLSQIWTSRQSLTTTIADLRYTYDPAGNVTRLSDLTSGDHQCFRNDHLTRLTEAWTPATADCAPAPATSTLGGPAKYWHSYRYDAAGNRTRLVSHEAAGDVTTDYAIAPGTHLLTGTTTTRGTSTTTAGYTYDAMGNMITRPADTGSGTQTLTWTPEGRLGSSADTTGTTSFVYDGDGNRLVRIDPGGRTLHLPGQELRAATSGARTATRTYGHAGATVAFRTAAGLTWLSGDAQGTASIGVDARTQAVSVRRQTPYGVPRAGAGSWPTTMDKGFVGGTNDNTGLVHLGAREYDAGAGRFISRDPIADTTNPQQLNGYAYSGNAPVTTSDPTGLLGSASCAPGYVGGPGACTGTENTAPPPTGAGWGNQSSGGNCTSQGSASNCGGGSGRPPSSTVGQCDAHHSASNCGAAPPENPWDVIQTIPYENGTVLRQHRNGRWTIGPLTLPDGVINPEEFARSFDDEVGYDLSQGTDPYSPHNLANNLRTACNPQICTKEAWRDFDKLYYDTLRTGGFCISGSFFYGMVWGGEACMLSVGDHTYVTVSGSRGWGWDYSISVTRAEVHVDDPKKLCGKHYYVEGGWDPVHAGTEFKGDGHAVRTNAGWSAGWPGGSFGPTWGYGVWQFGGNGIGPNLCAGK